MIEGTRAQRRQATAMRILEAARAEFGAHGHEGATIRGIAKQAGVDPSLVLQHYGSKQALFSLAVSAHDAPPEDVPRHLEEVLSLRLKELPPSTRALMRSMLTSPEAAGVMRAYLEERADNLAESGQHSEAWAALVVSSIMGITIARHFLDLPALSAVDDEVVEELVASWARSLPGRPV